MSKRYTDKYFQKSDEPDVSLFFVSRSRFGGSLLHERCEKGGKWAFAVLQNVKLWKKCKAWIPVLSNGTTRAPQTAVSQPIVIVFKQFYPCIIASPEGSQQEEWLLRARGAELIPWLIGNKNRFCISVFLSVAWITPVQLNKNKWDWS